MLCSQVRAQFLIGELRRADLLRQRRLGDDAQIAMLPGMVADLEKRVGHQLLAAFGMGEKPFSAREERRLDVLRPQEIDDIALIAADFVALLAKIEGQRDELLRSRRQFNAPDRAERRAIGWFQRLATWPLGRRDECRRHILVDAFIASADRQAHPATSIDAIGSTSARVGMARSGSAKSQ